MKTSAAVPLLALALTACDPYYHTGPEPYPQGPQGYPGYPDGGPPMPPGGPVYPGPGQPVPPPPASAGQSTYRAIGTEPFWDLEIGREMIFTDRGNNVSISQATPNPVQSAGGLIYRTDRLEVTVDRRQCSDGMSERRYPDTVEVRVDGRQRYRGCGAPIEYFNQTDETGQPRYPQQSVPQPSYPAPGAPYGQPYPVPSQPPYAGPYGGPGYAPPGAPQGMPVIDLKGTNWRVLSVNGTRTPASNFYVNFMPGEMSAKFGCNSIGGRYTQAGSILSVGEVAGTQMACPDMAFESQAMRILMRPLTISGFGGQIRLSNERGTIELIRAR